MSWYPFPGAIRYGVRLSSYNVNSERTDLSVSERFYQYSVRPQLSLAGWVREADLYTVYTWSVDAYAEDGTKLATNEGIFSTSPAKMRVPIDLPSLGVHTVLPIDWHLVAPGVFEQVSDAGHKSTLTFEKLPGDSSKAALRERGVSEGEAIENRQGKRTWWSPIDLDGTDLVTATTEGGNAYLITLETEDTVRTRYR